MEFRFYIDVKKKVIIEVFYGNITISQVEQAVPYIVNHADYDREFDGIIDLRKANLKYAKEDLNHFVAHISESEQKMKGRAAILVSEPMSAAIATLYGHEMKSLHEVGIFSSEFRVCDYLQISQDIFKSIDDQPAIALK